MSEVQSRSDRELLDAYVRGDEAALGELVRRHGPMVLGTCRRVLGESGEAEDAAQAVFMVLSRKARGLRGKADLGGWLYRSAWYSSTVALRARRRRSAREEEAGAMRFAEKSASYSEADWEGVRPRLDAEINRLPKSYRQVMVACHLEGRSQAETARELGLSASTVAGYCRRGLERLRRRLGVSLPAAALAVMLAEQTATELSAASLSSMLAAAKGAAPGNVGLIAEGIMKSMFWTKIKIAAITVIAAAAVGGGGTVALRELGAAESSGGNGKTASPKFPLNPKVAAMKDNSWIQLPTPKKHPMTRSSSPWMPYVPEAGVGIMWGCSHSGYHNDVWTYDLAANVWTEKLKTEPSAAKDPEVLKYKDGLLMTRMERPLSAHQWGRMDYDPDRKVLWHQGGYWQGVYGIAHHYKKIGKTIKQEGDPEKHKQLTQKGPPLWQYSLKENKWRVVYTEDPSKCTRYIGYIRYHPGIKKLIMTPRIVTPNEDRWNYKVYDPATNKWEMLKVTWKPLPGEKVSRYWHYGNSPIVYDAKRKVLVHIFSAGGVWLLDPVKKTMTQVIAKDKTLPANLDGPIGAFVYDSVAERLLAIFVNYEVYGAGKKLKERAFPIDRVNVWALDIEKKKWVLQPKPADGGLPPLKKGGSTHHFYDPVQNAAFIFRGGYNRTGGECWVYRYKRRRK